LKLDRKTALPILLAVGVGAVLAIGAGAWKLMPAGGPLAGQWKNLDPQNPLVTRVAIGRGWAGAQLKVWSRCKPADCDWGIPVTTDERYAARGLLSAVWDDGAARRTQQISILPDGRLRVVTRTHAAERSGKPEERIEYFGRAK
jgi:hypothetical protein